MNERPPFRGKRGAERRLVDRISTEYAERKAKLDATALDFDVAAVAAHVGLSRSQLTRLYLRHRKIGPAERFQQLRVERATRLLTASALTVKEIAHACGFVCPNHFCRVFRKQTRMTPSHYREAIPAWSLNSK